MNFRQWRDSLVSNVGARVEQSAEPIHVTVTSFGHPVHVSGLDFGAAVQELAPGPTFFVVRAPPEAARDTLDPDDLARVYLEVNDRAVGMEITPDHEGDLFRIHVSKLRYWDPGERKFLVDPNRTVVIGYYDELGSYDALKSEKTECYTCPEMEVCAVKPICF